MHKSHQNHGLWDYYIASAPNLVDIVVDSRPIKAVPQSTVAGERTHPTQPHPTWPLPFECQGMSEDDLIDFTPEIAAAAMEVFNTSLSPVVAAITMPS